MSKPETKINFTPTQLRALDWLPSDGSWRIKAGSMSPALDSLRLRESWRPERLCEVYYGPVGPRGGRGNRWRLTPTGIEVKQMLANIQAKTTDN